MCGVRDGALAWHVPSSLRADASITFLRQAVSCRGDRDLLSRPVLHRRKGVVGVGMNVSADDAGNIRIRDRPIFELADK